MKLDVVSLAELNCLVDAAQPSEQLSADLVAQIKAVGDHIDEQLKYVSHERRSDISLGAFLARHHYLSASSYQNYSSDLLKDKIEQALGPSESKEDTAAAIDWELDGVRAHPASKLATSDG